MDEWNKTQQRFELLLGCAKRGDHRSMVLARREAARLQELAEEARLELNKTVPRVLRHSYTYENWIESMMRHKKHGGFN